MSPTELENLLNQIEQNGQTVGEAVSQGQPEAIASASADLQKLAVSLTQLLHGPVVEAIAAQQCRARLKKISEGLALQREQLLRRSAVNERALNTMVPATQESGYAQAAGLYGGTARSSGAFTLLSA